MAATPTGTGGTGSAAVSLRVPADGAFVAVLRTTTAALAARLDFTLDDIEDLKIAVGEACALVLPEADEGADLDCDFHLGPGLLSVGLAVAATSPAPPDLGGFAWQVLTTLAGQADLDLDPGRFGVRLTMHSSALPPTPPDADDAGDAGDR